MRSPMTKPIQPTKYGDCQPYRGYLQLLLMRSSLALSDTQCVPSLHCQSQLHRPLEQLPLAVKHVIGAHRQFVHADESIQRSSEFALLAVSQEAPDVQIWIYSLVRNKLQQGS